MLFKIKQKFYGHCMFCSTTYMMSIRICFGCLQVIGAVGFMNQRLDIPKEVDLRWASIIESCWHRCFFSSCLMPALTEIS